MRAIFPTRALAVLLAIGLLDLIATAILHAQGQIQELNPLMAPVLGQSETKFVLVKGATLVFAWILLVRYARHDLKQVRRACLWGTAAYISMLSLAFFAG